MKNTPFASARAFFAGAFVLLSLAGLDGAESEDAKPRKGDLIITVISSTVYNGYERARTPDGKTKQETYALGDGLALTEGPYDRHLEEATFADVAKTLVRPLAQQAYVTGVPPEKTDLLIMVKWGSTGVLNNSAALGSVTPPTIFMPNEEGPTSTSKPSVRFAEVATIQPGILGGGAMATAAEDERIAYDMMTANQNMVRDEANARTAGLLGYDRELARVAAYQSFSGMRDYRAQLIGDLEDSRYFVVLMAYDFQKLRKEKQKKLLWITRFSIRTRGARFDRDLAAMMQMASRYFGRDTGGLKRDVGGQVRLDDIKLLEYEVQK